MKKLFAFIALFFLTFGSLNAQNLRIYMPDWKTTSAQDVLDNLNFKLPYDPTYEADRCDNSQQYENYKYSPQYVYPTMMPLLVVAEVPTGGKNVTWNIDNDNVQILAAPKGSQFFGKNHVVTPVNGGKITVENPYKVNVYENGACTWSFDGVEGLNPNKVQVIGQDIIFSKSSESSKRCEVRVKDFNLQSNQTYIIVLSTKPNVSFITASVDELFASSGSYIKSKVKFSNMNLTLNNNATPNECEDYSLVISGGPIDAPVNIGIGQPNKVEIEFTITNTGNQAINLSNVALQYRPLEKKWFEPFIESIDKGVLESQKSIKIRKTIDINEGAVAGQFGYLKSEARIYYPTAPSKGKFADIHVTYRREEKADLAGIKTMLDYAGEAYQLSVINVTPALDAMNNTAVIKLNSVKGNTEHINVTESLYNGQSWSDDITNGGLLTIKYSLFNNNKRIATPVLRLNK